MPNIPWARAPGYEAYRGAYAQPSPFASFLGGAVEGGLSMAQFIAKQKMERKQFKLKEQQIKAREDYNREMMKAREGREKRAEERHKELMGEKKRTTKFYAGKEERARKIETLRPKASDYNRYMKAGNTTAANQILAEFPDLKRFDGATGAFKLYKPTAPKGKEPKKPKGKFSDTIKNKAKAAMITWYRKSKPERDRAKARDFRAWTEFEKALSIIQMTPFQQVIDRYTKKYGKLSDEIMIKILSLSEEEIELQGF